MSTAAGATGSGASGRAPGRGRARLLQANSTVAFVLAAVVVVTLHETAHAVAGLALGLTPTLYANAVGYEPEPGRTAAVVTAAAGPLSSLVLGLLVHLFTRSTGRGFGRLFWLWTGLLALQNFAGYLVIAPFARAGDTGQVFALLALPGAAYVLAVVVGAALMLANARLLAAQVVRYATSPDELRHTVLFPWLLGSAVVVVLTLLDASRSSLDPGSSTVIVAGAATVGIFAPMFSFFYRRLDRPYERLDLRRPLGPVVVTVLAALAVFTLLAPGLRLG